MQATIKTFNKDFTVEFSYDYCDALSISFVTIHGLNGSTEYDFEKLSPRIQQFFIDAAEGACFEESKTFQL